MLVSLALKLLHDMILFRSPTSPLTTAYLLICAWKYISTSAAPIMFQHATWGFLIHWICSYCPSAKYAPDSSFLFLISLPLPPTKALCLANASLTLRLTIITSGKLSVNLPRLD